MNRIELKKILNERIDVLRGIYSSKIFSQETASTRSQPVEAAILEANPNRLEKFSYSGKKKNHFSFFQHQFVNNLVREGDTFRPGRDRLEQPANSTFIKRTGASLLLAPNPNLFIFRAAGSQSRFQLQKFLCFGCRVLPLSTGVLHFISQTKRGQVFMDLAPTSLQENYAKNF